MDDEFALGEFLDRYGMRLEPAGQHPERARARWRTRPQPGWRRRPVGPRGADRTAVCTFPTADLAPIRELYARGMYVQALRVAERFGPLTDWANTPARLLGGAAGHPARRRRARPPAPPAGLPRTPRRTPRPSTTTPATAWSGSARSPPGSSSAATPTRTGTTPRRRSRPTGTGCTRSSAAACATSTGPSGGWPRPKRCRHDRAWLCVERAAVLNSAERPEDALAVARKARLSGPRFPPRRSGRGPPAPGASAASARRSTC